MLSITNATRAGTLLLLVVGASSCKQRAATTELAGEKTDAVAAQLDTLYAHITEFQKSAQRDYTLTCKNRDCNQYDVVKHSAIVAIEQEFDRGLTAVEGLGGFYLEKVRNKRLDLQQQLKNSFSYMQLSLYDGFWANDLTDALITINKGIQYGSLWEYCADVVVQKKNSYEHFRNEISQMGIISGKSIRDGWQWWLNEDSERTLMWVLAGKPKVRVSVPGNLADAAGQNECRSDIPRVDTPEGTQIKDANWKTLYAPDCVQKIQWKKLVVSYHIDNINNLKDIYDYVVRYCPVIFYSIDEIRMEKGPAAFPTFGGRRDISTMGKSRELSREPFLQRLSAQVDFIAEMRASLKGEPSPAEQAAQRQNATNANTPAAAPANNPTPRPGPADYECEGTLRDLNEWYVKFNQLYPACTNKAELETVLFRLLLGKDIWDNFGGKCDQFLTDDGRRDLAFAQRVRTEADASLAPKTYNGSHAEAHRGIATRWICNKEPF